MTLLWWRRSIQRKSQFYLIIYTLTKTINWDRLSFTLTGYIIFILYAQPGFMAVCVCTEQHNVTILSFYILSEELWKRHNWDNKVSGRPIRQYCRAGAVSTPFLPIGSLFHKRFVALIRKMQTYLSNIYILYIEVNRCLEGNVRIWKIWQDFIS